MPQHDAVWHALSGDQKHGPMSRAQVMAYLRDGTLGGSDFVWRPGFEDWVPLREVRELSQPMDEGNPFVESIAGVISLVIWGGLLFGPGVLCWQILQWLKNGQWSPVPVSKALDYVELPYPDLEWQGVQKILDNLLDLPLSVVSFILAVSVFAAVAAAIDQLQRKHRQP
jgi:hypothetical protein